MKKVFLTCLLFLICFGRLFSQEETNQYLIKNIGILVKQCDINGKIINESNILAEPNKYFIVLYYKNSDSAVITFGVAGKLSKEGKITITDNAFFEKFNVDKNVIGLMNVEKNEKQQNTYSYSDFIGKRSYFLICRKDIISLTNPVYKTGKGSGQFVSGVITMPIKLRFKDFDFQPGVNLGGAVGIKWRTKPTKDNYHNILISVGISTTNLDSFSTRGRVPTQPINNVGLFSIALGYVIQIKSTQLGIFIGQDYLSKAMQDKYTWRYNKKLWLSIGVGIDIFKGNISNDKKSSEQSN